MTDRKFTAVFRFHGSYSIAKGTQPDQHEGPFDTKLDALLAARQEQIRLNRDPNFVVDLIGVPDDELREFLR